MSDGGSERAPAGEPFQEGDTHTTTLGYDRGGVPLYVALVWVAIIAAYVGFMIAVALPDFLSWVRF